MLSPFVIILPLEAGLNNELVLSQQLYSTVN